MRAIFLRVLEELEDKESALEAVLRDPNAAQGRQRFDVDVSSFATVPGSPFAYWAGDRMRELFEELPPFEAEGRTARQGLATADDFRFVRAWWAVPPRHVGEKWFPFAKGGKFLPFYSDVFLVVNWARAGMEDKAYIIQRYPYLKGNAAFVAKNTGFYLRPGLTWPRRTKSELSLRVMPKGCVFADKGPALFVEDDEDDLLLAMLSLGSSRVFRALVELQLAAADAKAGGAAHSFEVGVIQRTPVPRLRLEDRSALARLALRSWALKRSLDSCVETSHAFVLPALLQVSGETLASRAAFRSRHIETGRMEQLATQAEIDELCFGLYALPDAERRAIVEGFGVVDSSPGAPDILVESAADPEDAADEDGDEDGEEEQGIADAANLAADLVSWAVGASFGRFDIRLATGARPRPEQPKPFDSLPACSSAMLTGADGLPVPQPPPGYAVDPPENGILVDDPGHPRDLTAAVRRIFDLVFGADADRWWADVSALLDSKGHDLRGWLAGSFFEYHIKLHSKSRRKAPIVWQIGTPSGIYSIWLYAHRVTHDALFHIQNEVLGPKLAHEERQLTNLIQSAGGSASAQERKQISQQQAFVEELRALLGEVKTVAPIWNLNLDDGVVPTMAPLWPLVAQHKPWQRVLKAKWEDLAAGKNDWAHVAMRLWPERVIPQCASDRSLAIAHGLEDVFWAVGDGKWLARAAPTRPVDELVRERTSSAVKAALANMTKAPAASPATESAPRRRVRRAAAAEGEGR